MIFYRPPAERWLVGWTCMRIGQTILSLNASNTKSVGVICPQPVIELTDGSYYCGRRSHSELQLIPDRLGYGATSADHSIHYDYFGERRFGSSMGQAGDPIHGPAMAGGPDQRRSMTQRVMTDLTTT
jgi:hypothetical protein